MTSIEAAPTRIRRRPKKPLWPTLAICAAAGAAAAFAPATLTGNPFLDAVERALFTALLTFVGAYAHRWTWFATAALLAVAARDFSLILLIASVALALSTSRARRRSRNLGAVVVGLQWNALFWLPAETPVGVGALLALIVAMVLLISGAPEMRRTSRRTVYLILGVAASVAILAVGVAALAALSVIEDVNDGSAAARRSLTLVQDGDTEQASAELELARTHLADADDRLRWTTFAAGAVPGAAQQVDATRAALAESLKVTGAAEELLEIRYDDLRYEGRVALGDLLALTPQARRVSSTLAAAERNLAEQQTKSLLPPLRDRLDELTETITDARIDAETATRFLEVAPELLGAGGPKRYLVVFLAPAEQRGAGGFIANFVELEAAGGKVSLTRSGRIAELITARPRGERTLEGPQEYLDRYGRFQPQDFLQDISLSPHWPHVGEVLAQIYPQSGGNEVDAVVGVDPAGLAGLLRLTGPVAVDGLDETLDTNGAADFLNRGQYLIGDDRAEREEILEAATRATFEVLTEASLPSPRVLGDVLGPLARGGHLKVWSPTDRHQDLFDRTDATGRMNLDDGTDGFSVIQQNTGNSKIDAYMRRTVDYQAEIDARTGAIHAQVRIELHNDIPSLDLPRVVIGNNRGQPNGTSYLWLTFFTPHVVTSATLDGEPLTLGPGMEAGLRTWDTPFIAIGPGDRTVLELELEGGVDLSEEYRFTYLPQPMVIPDEVSVRLEVLGGDLSGPEGRTDSLGVSGIVTEGLSVAGQVRRR